MDNYKRCCKCKQTLTTDSFYKNKSTKDGLQSLCKPCNMESNRIWQQKNLDRFAHYTAEYRKRNPEKTKSNLTKWRDNNKEHTSNYSRAYRRKNTGYTKRNKENRKLRIQQAGLFLVTPKDVKKIMSNPCLYCGAASKHLDHIVPLSRGGRHSIGNLAPACVSCNQKKYNKYLSEWRYKS